MYAYTIHTYTMYVYTLYFYIYIYIYIHVYTLESKNLIGKWFKPKEPSFIGSDAGTNVVIKMSRSA